MNWVGGSRSRSMMKNDTRKQREFFEKKRMQNKIKHLGLPSSPKGGSTGSMDLVTLFIVSQIASKKENNSQPKITHLGDAKGAHKSMREEALELPMSPCSPSRLCLAESQPQYSVQALGLGKRKRCLSEGFKCKQQLSPVLESNLSDNSATDYQHHIQDTFSPFSSASSVSSGALSLHPRSKAALSPRPWEPSHTEQAQFLPFLQPRGVQDRDPWTTASNGSQHLLQTTPVSRVYFGSAEPNCTESRSHASHSDGFSLDPMDSDEQPEGLLFMGFDNKQYGGQAPPFDETAMKIHLHEEIATSSARAQDLNGSQNRDLEADFLTKVSKCSDYTPSGSGHTLGGSVASCESPSYSPRGYFSTDSDEGEEDDPCLQGGASHMEKSCHVETPIASHCSSGKGAAQERSDTLPFSQSMKSIDSNSRTTARSEEVLSGLVSCGRELSGGRKSEKCVPSYLQSEEGQESAPPETRDVGTQTVTSASSHSDASTQCSLGEGGGARASSDGERGRCTRSVYEGRRAATARGQHGPSNEARSVNTHKAPPGRYRQEEYTPWKAAAARKQRFTSPTSHTGNRCLRKPVSQACVKMPPTPVLDCLHRNSAQETREEQPSEHAEPGGKCEGQDLDEGVIKDPVENVKPTEDPVKERSELKAESGVNWVAEEMDTLQEIADILLMLKHKNKEQ